MRTQEKVCHMTCSLGLMVMGLVASLSVANHPIWPIFDDSGSLLVACTSLSQDGFQRGGFWEVVGPHRFGIRSDQIRSVAESCPTLCDPINRSTPGLPVHHQPPEFTQTHVHRVSDAIQPSHPCRPFLLLPPIPPSIRESFPMSQLFA